MSYSTVVVVLVGGALVAWALAWVVCRKQRRLEERRGQLPPPVPVVQFRPGARLSPQDVDELEEQLRIERALRRAFRRDPRWAPSPTVRA